MNNETKTACRTPAEGRDGVTYIPTWKYDVVRDAIQKVVREAGKAGISFGELPAAVAKIITKDDLSRLGSISWHVTTVKLNMEVEGELKRMAANGPQRLILG